ncbi:hypothetical protein GGF32_004327 [Allomyces javanicus]|nr:hypothetical protein GGF32_004327 [Allomyces javanicus]
MSSADHDNERRGGTKRKAGADEIVEPLLDNDGNNDSQIEPVAEIARPSKRQARVSAEKLPASSASRASPTAADAVPVAATDLSPGTRVAVADSAVIRFLEHDLDLSLLVDDLQHDPTFPLPAVSIPHLIREYRWFLVLKFVHRDEHAQLLSPSPVIDLVWHAHLLDTKAYTAMCAKLPFFIHHNPKGKRDDFGRRDASRQRTRTCYAARYGGECRILWCFKCNVSWCDHCAPPDLFWNDWLQCWDLDGGGGRADWTMPAFVKTVPGKDRLL